MLKVLDHGKTPFVRVQRTDVDWFPTIMVVPLLSLERSRVESGSPLPAGRCSVMVNGTEFIAWCEHLRPMPEDAFKGELGVLSEKDSRMVLANILGLMAFGPEQAELPL